MSDERTITIRTTLRLNLGRAAGTLVSFTSGNFLYQALMRDPDWGVAVERSFFGIVCAVVVIACSRESRRG